MGSIVFCEVDLSTLTLSSVEGFHACLRILVSRATANLEDYSRDGLALVVDLIHLGKGLLASRAVAAAPDPLRYAAKAEDVAAVWYARSLRHVNERCLAESAAA